jgi:hypothetical protein
MDVHQTEFLQAIVLAGVVALSMTVWDEGRGPAKGDGRPKAEILKDHVHDRTAFASAREAPVQRDR